MTYFCCLDKQILSAYTQIVYMNTKTYTKRYLCTPTTVVKSDTAKEAILLNICLNDHCGVNIGDGRGN